MLGLGLGYASQTSVVYPPECSWSKEHPAYTPRGQDGTLRLLGTRVTLKSEKERNSERESTQGIETSSSGVAEGPHNDL